MHIYAGIFLVAMSTLALEVALTRLLSVMTWYSLAFFAISTAMIGMTAGAVWVYLRPAAFTRERIERALSRYSLGLGLFIPVMLVMLCQLALTIDGGLMTVFSLLTATLFITGSFFFSGVVITAVLTRSGLPIGRIYACDLAGAASGCLLCLAGLQMVNTPSFILLCGAVSAGAAFLLGIRTAGREKWFSAGAAVLVFLLSCWNLSPNAIRPLLSKGVFLPPTKVFMEEWNSISRVTIRRPGKGAAFYWEKSSAAPPVQREQVAMAIDGLAGTHLVGWDDRQDLAFLEYDLVNTAYAIRDSGGACIIGVGAGRDVLSALWFGHDRIVGVEVNSIFIRLLREDFRALCPIAGQEEIELVVDEARSYLSRTEEKFSLIQMSMIDTWAATGAGAYCLSENSLYTLDAWRIFMSRLKPDGVLTVSRWYDPEFLGETGRLMSLAVATLFEMGVENPQEHLALITVEEKPRLATLIMSRQPLTAGDLTKLKQYMARMNFEAIVFPGEVPDSPMLAEILACRSRDELNRAIDDYPLNLSPPDDDSPYFFNMLRLNKYRKLRQSFTWTVRGNLKATWILLILVLCLAVAVAITIVLPLVLKTLGSKPGELKQGIFYSSAAYFGLIGLGFMLVEIGLLQRTTTFLGHPVYALGILLFTLILSTGIGSLLSEKLPLLRRPGVYIFPLAIVAVVLAARFAMPVVFASMESAALGKRMAACVALLSPVGILLGLCYPTGMRLVEQGESSETPWYWALNGICGVFASAVAVLISIYFGISTTLYAGAICYLLLLAVLPLMYGRAREKTL